MRQFIVLTAITGELIAIRPTSILHLEECNGKDKKIIVKTEMCSWNISAEYHSIDSIIKEIENFPIND